MAGDFKMPRELDLALLGLVLAGCVLGFSVNGCVEKRRRDRAVAEARAACACDDAGVRP